jgi:hypothetical protein
VRTSSDESTSAVSSARPAPLAAVLAVTFLGSVSGGAFWSGLFFVTDAHYRFSPARNLVLAAIMGAVYAAGARASGRLSRTSAPRRVLALCLSAWALVAAVPTLMPSSEPALWFAALLGSLASAVIWPIVESFLTAGRHGAEMRAAIGWFNVTWTPATAVSLVVMPWFARGGGLGTFALSGLANVAALIVLAALPSRPGAHATDAASVAVGPEYGSLARSASWLLPLSYVISATLAPVLPARLAAVGVAAPPSQVAALWMAARFATLFLMWRTGFWHGRWATLGLGGAGLAGGLALVLLAQTPATIVAGLLLYGTGMGLTYYAALYYSMAVGHAAVDAGGNFEALIGVGYCVGPMLGVVGHAVASPSSAGTATVVLTWLVTGLASRGAIRPYLDARRRRRPAAPGPRSASST